MVNFMIFFGFQIQNVGMLVLTICFAVCPIVGVVLALRFIYGAGWGICSTASSTIAADVIPRRRFGEGMGYFALTNSISSALAPALGIALVHGPDGIYMLAMSAAFTAVGLAISIFIRNKQREDDHARQPESASEYRGIEAFIDRRSVFPAVVIMLVNFGFGTIITFIAPAIGRKHAVTFFAVVGC